MKLMIRCSINNKRK